jgi:hypothetical protein
MPPVAGRAVLAIAAFVVLTTCGVDRARAHDGGATTPAPGAVVASDVVDNAAAVTRSSAAVIAAPPETASIVLWPALLALAVTIGLRWLPRRAVALAIVPLLIVVAFEAGVHGVHHLGDARAGAECSVAVSAEHVSGAPVDVPAGFTPAPLVSSPLALAETLRFAEQQYSPGDGRAPPVLSA